MDFDQYAKSYHRDIQSAVAIGGQPPDFYTRLKADRLLEMLASRFPDLTKIHVLDLGCGVGSTDQLLSPSLPGLVGADISDESLMEAKARNPSVRYVHYDGRALPFETESFDVVFAICVWHHVPKNEWSHFADEIFRVTKRSGLGVIFEHNPRNPLTRRVVDRCVFDKDAVLLKAEETSGLLLDAGFSNLKSEYLLFVPFDFRWIRKIEHGIMSFIPYGAQYAVTAEKTE